VLFAAWGAQEMGNLGSEFYVNQPVFPLESTIAALHLDGVGGGEGFNLGAQAVWESDAILLDNLGIAESALGEKIVVTEPYSYSDHLSFQIEGIPSILLSWRLANEENLPDYLTNSVNPDRLRISGRVTSLLLMNLGR
jgi:Zn-dependent M28 family amino/carboxypeptidase